MADTAPTKGERARLLLQDLASKKIPFEELIKGMTPQQIVEFVEGQYAMMDEQRIELQRQLDELRDKIIRGDSAMADRIERVQTLMTSHMTFIKQLTQLLTSNSESLNALEKSDIKHELQIANIVDKQNRFATSVTNMSKNATLIMAEIEKLKQADVNHDKFQFKLTCILSVGAVIVTWLLTGDNFAKIVTAINEILEHQ